MSPRVVMYAMVSAIMGLASASLPSTVAADPVPHVEGPLPKVQQKNLLESTPWRLVTIGSNRALLDGQAILTFEGGRLTGSAGCNRIFGSYAAAEGDLKLGSLGLTRMACDDSVLRQEDHLIRALQKTTTYQIHNGGLELSDGKKTLAIFEPTRPQNAYRVEPLSQ